MTEKNATGDWNQIGYTGPGKRSTSAKYKTNEFTYEGTSNSWKATNNNKLNECSAGGIWQLTATLNSAADNAQGQSSMTLAVADDGKQGLCLGLTPSFESLKANYQ